LKLEQFALDFTESASAPRSLDPHLRAFNVSFSQTVRGTIAALRSGKKESRALLAARYSPETAVINHVDERDHNPAPLLRGVVQHFERAPVGAGIPRYVTRVFVGEVIEPAGNFALAVRIEHMFLNLSRFLTL
jgi:hypothetical protein